MPRNGTAPAQDPVTFTERRPVKVGAMAASLSQLVFPIGSSHVWLSAKGMR